MKEGDETGAQGTEYRDHQPGRQGKLCANPSSRGHFGDDEPLSQVRNLLRQLHRISGPGADVGTRLVASVS